MPKATDDVRLVIPVHAEEPIACELMFTRYYAFLCNVASNAVRSEADGEDIVADIFLKLLEHPGRFMTRQAAKPFLCVLVKNKARDRLRHRRVTQRYEEFQDVRAAKSVASLDDPHLMCEAVETAERIALLMLKMSPQVRNVVELNRDGWSHYEIAGILGISQKAVRNYLWHGRRWLNQSLGTDVMNRLEVSGGEKRQGRRSQGAAGSGVAPG